MGKSDDQKREINTTCPLCGEGFHCGCLSGDPKNCWCVSLPVAELNLPFEDKCLCPKCLQKEIEKQNSKKDH